MFCIFFILWLILNGRITLEIVLFGLGVTALVGFFAVKVLGYPVRTELRLVKGLPLLVVYVLVLVREAAAASWQVLRLAFSPGARPEPVIIEFHSGLEGRFKNVLLANSITLTPGTYTVFQEGDRFVVHCLRREYADGIEDSVFVRLLRRIP